MPRRSSSGPPEAFSPPFSPLCPRIRGLFPAIEFVVAFSPSLTNFGDPGTPLAHACLNSDDFTAAERSSTARSHSSSPVRFPPQVRATALESREVNAVEALKQAKDEHVQKLMEAYLVTHNQRRALRIQEPASSNPVQSMRVEDPQVLEGHPVSTRGEKKAWELLDGAIVLEGIPISPQAMNKQEHPESSQDPLLELFEPLTMKKIPASSLEVKEEATSTPPAPPPSEELQELVQLEKEFDPVLPSQSPPEEVIKISSLLTHPRDVLD
uniref:Uncharacterized protein n=1 Tax=Zea mays TaxID=4577 RepID=A0A804Q9X3_MAIZE